MQLHPQIRRHRSRETDVLPMINIVFLLLIFFMVVGTLQSRPPFEVDPPASTHASENGVESRYLAVSAGGDLAFGGRRMAEDELISRLSASDDGVLHIRAHRDVPTERVARLLARVRDSGIASVRLMTVHGAE